MKNLTFRTRLFTALISVGLAAILFCAVVSGLMLSQVTQELLADDYSASREMLSMVSHGFWQSELFSYRQALQHAGIMLEHKEFDGDGALLDYAASEYGRIRAPYSEVFFLARNGAVDSALTATEGNLAAADAADVTRMLEAAGFESEMDAKDLKEVLSTGDLVVYNSEAEGTPLLTTVSLAGGAALGVFLLRAQAEGMIQPLYQLGDDMHQAAADRFRAVVRNSLLLLAGFGLLMAAAVALIARKLSAGVSTPVEREHARQQALIAQAQQEKRMLEEVDRLKTEFLGNISHELKTPLTVVSSRVQYAREGLDPEETARVLKLIGGEVDRMAVMISQLLDVSRIEEGRMWMDRRKESIVEIIQSTLDDYYPAFVKGGNRLTFRREGNVPQVSCDRARVTQVLVNLIGNAARHTRRGEIVVSVRADGGAAEVTVADDGEGIPPEQFEHLFERYHSGRAKGDPARSGADTGTGLGLYISRHIVEEHSGRIWIESEAGKGARAHFTLPLDT
jgi:signal transduction histidine kinase